MLYPCDFDVRQSRQKNILYHLVAVVLCNIIMLESVSGVHRIALSLALALTTKPYADLAFYKCIMIFIDAIFIFCFIFLIL